VRHGPPLNSNAFVPNAPRYRGRYKIGWGDLGDRVGVRIIIFWKSDGFVDDFEYDIPIRLNQLFFRALMKEHTSVEAPGRSVLPFRVSACSFCEETVQFHDEPL
jgi:hypothetical protein